MESKSQQQPDNCTADQFFRDLNIEFLIHELKDPLSIIETGTLILLEKQQLSGPLTVRQEKMLQRVLRSSRKVRSMVYELLEVGRAGAACFISSPFKPEPVLHQVLAEVIESHDFDLFEQLNGLDDFATRVQVLASHHIELKVDAVSQNYEIVQDQMKFSQIIANLLKNAFHFRQETVQIHLAQDHPGLSLSVTDDGPGINPIHHEAVFERYRQVAPAAMERRGHGLGLAMARILARSMGGDITLESELGQGSTFLFNLPKESS